MCGCFLIAFAYATNILFDMNIIMFTYRLKSASKWVINSCIHIMHFSH